MSIQHGTYAVPRMDLGAAFMEFDPEATGLIAEQVLPMLRVNRKAATFSKITRESLMKLAETKRTTGTNYNRIDTESEDDTYACEEHGLEDVLGDDERSLYMNDYDAEVAAVQHIRLKILLAQEIRVRTLVLNTTTWTGAALYTDISAAPWDAAASDAIGHVRAAKEKVRTGCGMPANSLIIGASTMNNLLANTAILGRFPGVSVLTEEMLKRAMASIFGLERLIVGGQSYDSAAEGQTFTGADIWADDYAMVARLASPNDSIKTPCIGRSFLWTEDSPQSPIVEQYREEQTRGDVFRCRHSVDEKIIDPYFGHLLKVDA